MRPSHKRTKQVFQEDLDFIILLFRQSFMTFCLILSTRQIFEPFFCFNFESRLLLKKGPQFNLNLGQKKVSKNFLNIFLTRKTFAFSQQTCQSGAEKMATHIFVASSLHFPSRKNVASREYFEQKRLLRLLRILR